MCLSQSLGYDGSDMSRKTQKHLDRGDDPMSLAPLTMDQAVDAIFQIKPADVRKILASKPGKKK
jgi:hypothetical protein